VLGDGLDGQEGLLADGSILLVGQLLLESLDSPEMASHVSSSYSPIFFGATPKFPPEKFSQWARAVPAAMLPYDLAAERPSPTTFS
jgi:hypothetical protein